MITASDSWKNLHRQALLPETFVEISCGVADPGIGDAAVATGSNEASFSNTAYAVKSAKNVSATKYATLEHNLWTLDGSCHISESQPTALGYVSNGEEAELTIRLPEVEEFTPHGFTITWGGVYGEYPTKFTVTAYADGVAVATTTVTDNASTTSKVDMDFTEFDTVVIKVDSWCLPDHRARIDLVLFGHAVVFTKSEIISFSQEQSGSLISGEIPKSSIQFTVDNTDGRWSLNNPTGIEQYLAERQPVTVRFGMNVNGAIEWIPGGKFYLSEWKTSANSLVATFAARDVFEYLLEAKHPSIVSGTLKQIVETVLAGRIPDDCVVTIDDSLSNYSATTDGSHTVAEIVQMCANAAGCVIRYDRAGNLHIEPLNVENAYYQITKDLSYSYPELTLSKHMKEISVAYGSANRYVLPVGDAGETQTVDNPLITSENQATAVASCVKYALKTRQSVSGEYRADPRMDVFDVVSVAGRYSVFPNVAITNVKYDFAGSFRARFEGKVIPADSSNVSVLGAFILGKGVLS